MVKKASRSGKPAANQEFLSGVALQLDRPSNWNDFGAGNSLLHFSAAFNSSAATNAQVAPPSPPLDDAVIGTGDVQGVQSAAMVPDGRDPQELHAGDEGGAPDAEAQSPGPIAPQNSQQPAAAVQQAPRRSVTCAQCGRAGHQKRTCRTAEIDYVPGFPRALHRQIHDARAAGAARLPVAEQRQVALADAREPLNRNIRRANVPDHVADNNNADAVGGVLRHQEDMPDDGVAGDDDDGSGSSSDSSVDDADSGTALWNFCDSQWQCVCDQTAGDGHHAIPLPHQSNFNLRSTAAGEDAAFGREVPSFRGQGAAAINIPRGCSTAKDFVDLIFSDDIVQQLVDSTNAAAHPETGHPRVKELWRTRKRWHDVDQPKMRTWLCVAVYLGVVKVQNRKHIWSKSSIFRQPWVASKISALEFESILTALNFCEHWALTDEEFYRRNREDGPFWQVKELVARCNSNSQAYFRCGHRISIDEGVIPFKGKHCGRCFNPKKPFKYHLKKFMCNDSETGYCYRFYFYDGAGEVRPAGMPASAWPVVKLLSECTCLHDKNHLVATDNWFTSPTTSTWLQQHGFICVGTCKANRLHVEKVTGANQRPGFPRRGIFKGSRRPRGSIIVHQTVLGGKPHFVTSWQDKKPVIMLSSYMPSQTFCTRKVKIGGRWESVVYPRPSVIRHYNITMGGTDLHDQRVACFRSTLKSVRWHVRVLTDVFSSMLMNACILFKLHHKKPSAYSALDFLQEYLNDGDFVGDTEGLDDDHQSPNRPAAPQNRHKRAWWFGEEGSSIRKTGKHYLCHASELFGDETDQRRGCLWDPGRTGCGRTAYACKQCRVHVCIAHFEQFHEE